MELLSSALHMLCEEVHGVSTVRKSQSKHGTWYEMHIAKTLATVASTSVSTLSRTLDRAYLPQRDELEHPGVSTWNRGRKEGARRIGTDLPAEEFSLWLPGCADMLDSCSWRMQKYREQVKCCH